MKETTQILMDAFSRLTLYNNDPVITITRNFHEGSVDTEIKFDKDACVAKLDVMINIADQAICRVNKIIDNGKYNNFTFADIKFCISAVEFIENFAESVLLDIDGMIKDFENLIQTKSSTDDAEIVLVKLYESKIVCMKGIKVCKRVADILALIVNSQH